MVSGCRHEILFSKCLTNFSRNSIDISIGDNAARTHNILFRKMFTIQIQSIFSSFNTNLMMFENNSFHPRISQFLHYDAVSTRVITTSRLQSSTSCPLHCLLWTIYTSADIIQNQHHHNYILNIQIQLPLNFVSLVQGPHKLPPESIWI